MAMTDHDTAGGLCHQRAVRNRKSAADPQVQDATLDGYFVEPIGLSRLRPSFSGSNISGR